jgi:hypothetical protein
MFGVERAKASAKITKQSNENVKKIRKAMMKYGLKELPEELE